MTDQLLYNIDKRLAVMEAISKEHSVRSEEEFAEIRKDLKKVQDEMVKLKVRVATVSGGISMLVGLLFQIWRH